MLHGPEGCAVVSLNKYMLVYVSMFISAALMAINWPVCLYVVMERMCARFPLSSEPVSYSHCFHLNNNNNKHLRCGRYLRYGV